MHNFLDLMSYTTNFPHSRKRTCYVGGFGEDVNEKILTLAFIPFGDIGIAWIWKLKIT